ncbi:MAG TPA: hypothetical protein VKA49_03820 [Flavitalea sp.]|nr:hypothetical protein [Flavitalea sp.]
MKSILIYCLSILLCQCSPSLEIARSWKGAQKQKISSTSILIISFSGNEGIKKMIEADLAKVAKQKSYQAFKSVDHLKTEQIPNKDSALKKAIQLHCGTIFTAFLVQLRKERRYVPENPGLYGVNVGPVLDRSVGFESSTYSPGYYKDDEIYLFESNLYDVKTKKLIWSAQLEIGNLRHLRALSKKYARSMFRQMEIDGMIGK